ncbi:MAG: hypothetical protein ACO3HF_00990 [Burkholderiaceae bacterium]
MFSYERPIAQQTAIIANQNRDPKKQKKAFSFEDFSFYMPRDARNLPSGSYGAAAVMLLKEKRFPSWALFCYKDLVASARPSYEPELPALIAEDCILLHPTKVAGGWKGMMIAMESASDQKRVFTDGKGGSFVLNVPYVETKFVAEEDVTLQQ